MLIRSVCRYGLVVSAEDSETGQKVAIKKVPKAFEDCVDAKRILREIKLMRHFNHENVSSGKRSQAAERDLLSKHNYWSNWSFHMLPVLMHCQIYLTGMRHLFDTRK